jgi:hypothetical protein
MHEFKTDQGYSLRRAKHSKPTRGWVLDYLGRRSDEMRLIRDYLYSLRLGILETEFLHPTSADNATLFSGTPMGMYVQYGHGLRSGQWLGISLAQASILNETRWQVTVLSPTVLSLNNSPAVDGGFCLIQAYVPHARCIFNQDTWESPTKLIGPERNNDGAWNYQVIIEELF